MGALILSAAKWVLAYLFGGGGKSAMPAIQAEAEQKQAAVDDANDAKADTKALETHIENATHNSDADIAAAVDSLFNTPDAATRRNS